MASSRTLSALLRAVTGRPPFSIGRQLALIAYRMFTVAGKRVGLWWHSAAWPQPKRLVLCLGRPIENRPQVKNLPYKFVVGLLGAVEPLDRLRARREKACGRGDVDVRDEQPFLTVWLVAEQRPIGPHHRGSSRRPGACKVYS